MEKKKVVWKSAWGNYRRPLSRVDFQVFLMTALIVIFSCTLIFYINYKLSYNGMVSALQERAKNIHDFLERDLDPESFQTLDNREDDSSMPYISTKRALERVREAAGVRYLYTAKENAQGQLIYLVDGLPSESGDFRYVGDLIEPECIPDMQRALKGQTIFPEDITETSWGYVFISYFPMHAGDEIIGVLGLEFDAARQYKVFQHMKALTPLVILIFCLVTAGIAVLLFRRISNPSYRDMANTDFLTGVKNRNAFNLELQLLESRGDKVGIAFMLMDLDGLKQVNDTYGHGDGDRYIQRVCTFITEAVGDAHCVYRIGGDEFVVILAQKAQHEMEDIRSEIQRRVQGEQGFPFQMGISVGYAAYDPLRDQILEDTLKRADTRMYEEKRKSKMSSI